jgi:hypothetical protein
MLSAKRQIFVDEYCIDRNASRAARAAGYSAVSAKVTASRLLTDANVRAAVTVREIDAERTLDVTRERVVRALQGAFELARQQGDPMAMIAACREIARMCGYYVPDQKQWAPTPDAGACITRIQALSDSQLAELVTGGAGK